MIRARVDDLAWPAVPGQGTERPLICGTLKIARGSVSALMGASGMGKSTVLKRLAGYTHGMRGTFEVEATSKSGETGSVPRNQIVYLPQDSLDLLLPWYTTRRNLEIADGLCSSTTERADIEELSKRLGIESELDTYPERLSGGQRRRAALAMVILRGAEMLLLDEPFAGLDVDVRGAAWDLVWGAVRTDDAAGTAYSRVGAALVASHGIEDVAALCDSVQFIREGEGKTEIGEALTRPIALGSTKPSKLYFDEGSPLAAWTAELRRAVREDLLAQ